MFNMDETSHIAKQRHETIVAQKIKHLGVTASCECEQNMIGVFANNTSCFYIASVRNSSSSSSVICQTTGPKPLPKRFLHIVRSRASSVNWQYPLLSLRSSSSFLRLLPRLLITSICPFIFPSITCCRRQFPLKTHRHRHHHHHHQ